MAINVAEEPPTNNELLKHRRWKTQQFNTSFLGTIEALKVTTEHSLLIRMRNIAYRRFNTFLTNNVSVRRHLSPDLGRTWRK